jgi:sugar/nucleoside kinase (ribokinase family)
MTLKQADFVFLGRLQQDYLITHDGQSHEGILGGNTVYAAIGAKLWSDSIGIVSRVGSNFPDSLIADLYDAGINTDGVTVLPEPHESRAFYAYASLEERFLRPIICESTNPFRRNWLDIKWRRIRAKALPSTHSRSGPATLVRRSPAPKELTSRQCSIFPTYLCLIAYMRWTYV